MIRYNGVNHIAMATKDMDQTIRYWRDLLGMRLIFGMGKPGNRHYFFEISEKSAIAFFEWPDVEPVPEKEHGRIIKGPFIFDHVSFGVETENDLYDLKDKIDAAGFWVSEVIDHGFIHSIYSFDPNGIPVEFSWNVTGIDIRKNPVMGDPAPSDITKEGPEPQSDRWPQVTNPTPKNNHKVYPGEGSKFFKKT